MGDDDDEEKDCLVNTLRIGDTNDVGAVETVMDTRLQKKMKQDKTLKILCYKHEMYQDDVAL